MSSPIRKTTKGKNRNYLSVKEGAGMTERGRRAYNRKTGSNLQAPTKDKNNPRHKSFCARMGGIVKRSKNSDRAKASMRRWGCS